MHVALSLFLLTCDWFVSFERCTDCKIFHRWNFPNWLRPSVVCWGVVEWQCVRYWAVLRALAFVLMPRCKTGATDVCHDCQFTFRFQFLKFFIAVKVAPTSNLERVVETGVVWMFFTSYGHGFTLCLQKHAWTSPERVVQCCGSRNMAWQWICIWRWWYNVFTNVIKMYFTQLIV